jgi:hypothetical protein
LRDLTEDEFAQKCRFLRDYGGLLENVAEYRIVYNVGENRNEILVGNLAIVADDIAETYIVAAQSSADILVSSEQEKIHTEAEYQFFFELVWLGVYEISGINQKG